MCPVLEAADVESSHLTPGSCSVRLDRRAWGPLRRARAGRGWCGWAGGQEEKGLAGLFKALPLSACLARLPIRLTVCPREPRPTVGRQQASCHAKAADTQAWAVSSIS